MSSKNVFHLGICKDDISDANIVLMPGDPDRVDTIAAHLENPVLLASKRESTEQSWQKKMINES